MRKRAVIATVLALASALTIAGCTDNDGLAQQYRNGDTKNYISGNGAVTEFSPKDRGEPINFTTKDLSGKTLTADDYRGKVLVLNFWYASCAPCRAEAKDLEAVSHDTTDRASFLGVNVRDSTTTANAFIRTFDVPYDNVIDAETGTVQLAFAGRNAPNSTPATIVLDKQGRVSARILGQINKNVLATLIDDTAK